jgi:hypothetical protein
MSSNTNTSQLVDKNTFIRWFLTNDEPWTALVDKRTLIPKANHLHCFFKNGISITIRMDTDQHSITDNRRMLTDIGERKIEHGLETECNICLTSAEWSLNSVRVKCGCTFDMCLPCQRKIIEKKGYLQCPVCKRYIWGQDWFLVLVKGGMVNSTFECPPNNVFLQHFDEEINLQRWNKITRTTTQVVSMMCVPENEKEAFIDFVMGQEYDNMCKLVLSTKDSKKERAQVIENIRMVTRLYVDFQRKKKPPVRFRKPEPERFEPKNDSDILNLAQRILGH